MPSCPNQSIHSFTTLRMLPGDIPRCTAAKVWLLGHFSILHCHSIHLLRKFALSTTLPHMGPSIPLSSISTNDSKLHGTRAPTCSNPVNHIRFSACALPVRPLHFASSPSHVLYLVVTTNIRMCHLPPIATVGLPHSPHTPNCRFMCSPSMCVRTYICVYYCTQRMHSDVCPVLSWHRLLGSSSRGWRHWPHTPAALCKP